MLLRDCITEPDLVRAEALLNVLYRDFCELYGEGSCGLNIHDVGAHLVFYVALVLRIGMQAFWRLFMALGMSLNTFYAISMPNCS